MMQYRHVGMRRLLVLTISTLLFAGAACGDDSSDDGSNGSGPEMRDTTTLPDTGPRIEDDTDEGPGDTDAPPTEDTRGETRDATGSSDTETAQDTGTDASPSDTETAQDTGTDASPSDTETAQDTGTDTGRQDTEGSRDSGTDTGMQDTGGTGDTSDQQDTGQMQDTSSPEDTSDTGPSDTTVENDTTSDTAPSDTGGGRDATMADTRRADASRPDTNDAGGSTQPVISEVLYDGPSRDEDVFIEIKAQPNTDLSGLKIVGINGNGGGTYDELSLQGTTDANGFYLIVYDQASSSLQNKAQQIASEANLQNGPDNVQLRRGSTIVDALGYGDFSSATFAGEGNPHPDVSPGESVARYGSDIDTDDNAADFYAETSPTPGEPNTKTSP